MIPRSLILCCLLHLAAHASPVGVARSSDGSRLFIAMEDPPSVKVIDATAGTITATWPLPETPQSLNITPDGARLLVPAGVAPGKLLTLDAASGAVITSLPCGHSPRWVEISTEGKSAYVCHPFENRVATVDLVTNRVIAAIPMVRQPVAARLKSNGGALFVANLLPSGPANTGDIAAEISIADTATGNTQSIRLPNGSTDIRALAVSTDGRFVYAVHTLARYGLPTTQLDRGWMNTSALSVIDANQNRLTATILLDDIDLGAANPAGGAVSQDGRLLAITHAGTHELSLIDLAALHDRIDRVSRGEAITAVSRSIKDLPNDLSFLYGIRKRVKLAGNGPREVIATADGFAVICYFSRTLHMVRSNPDLTIEVRDIALAPDWRETTAQRGERLFHDATRCFQQWQSCITCHPGVRTDALNWDLLNDGVGNPKQTKSLLFSIQTPPAMISGIRRDAETAIRTGTRYILFAHPTEDDANAIAEFLRNLKPVPSPALVNGELSDFAKRGKDVFDLASCSDCHSGDYLSDGKRHNVGTGTSREEGKPWDTPTLREVWRTAPYLHDGRAATLEDVIGKANPDDRHGETSTLTDEQRGDLAEYLRSL